MSSVITYLLLFVKYVEGLTTIHKSFKISLQPTLQSKAAANYFSLNRKPLTELPSTILNAKQSICCM